MTADGIIDCPPHIIDPIRFAYVDGPGYRPRHGVRVLIDHLGIRDIGAGAAAPGFQAVLALERGGDAVVKLSAPFCLADSSQACGQRDEVAESLGIEGCVWGSDWPFFAVDGRVRYGDLPTTLGRWRPDPADRNRVLWTSPVPLFGFGA